MWIFQNMGIKIEKENSETKTENQMKVKIKLQLSQIKFCQWLLFKNL